jgi:hypothetical protein
MTPTRGTCGALCGAPPATEIPASGAACGAVAPVAGGRTNGTIAGQEEDWNILPFFGFSPCRRRRLTDGLRRMLRGKDGPARLFAVCVLRRRSLGNFAPLAPQGGPIARPAIPRHPLVSRPSGGAA